MDAELSPLGGYGRDLTAAQRRIVREMERLIAEGPAAFFRDACLLMAGEPSLSSTTHLVAHLLREMESGIRRALEPPKVVKGRDGGHRASVLAVLESLGIAAGHKAAVTWLALADQDGSEGLARRAHRAGLDAPRPVDASFSTYFAGLEELFDYVLDQCDKHYHTIFDHLDALAAIEAPTSADVEAFRRRPQTFTAVRHFLGAAGPQWVKPLTESDYFTSPPDPKPDADGRVELPPWLPSDYLARMAEAEPAYVVGAALSIPATDNSRVNHDVVRVALAVPADHALELAPQIIRSLSCKYGVLIPDQVGAVAAHLAGGGFAEPALALMAEVLRILPGQSDSVVGAWELAQVMGRDMPALVAVSGVKALAMVCARLDRFISEDLSWSKEESGSDLSSTWWPDLRSSPANRETEPAAVLAEGVLAAGVQTIRGDQGQVAAVFAELRAHRWIIYRRIRLHLLACFPGEASDILREHLLDPSNLADANVQREYLHLAQARCAELSDSDREHLVGLIEAGPDRGAWTAAYAKFYDHEPSAADVNRFADVWTRDRLLACEAILTPSARARRVALVAEYPPSTEPVAQTRSPFIEVPPPRTAAELSALTAEELVDFLRDWEPDAKAFLGPDKGTLAAVLREVIAADRQRWSTHARDFARDVEAVYVSAVLESLAQGNNDPAQLDWVSVLDLCELVDERASHETADALDGTGRPPMARRTSCVAPAHRAGAQHSGHPGIRARPGLAADRERLCRPRSTA